MTNKTTNKVCAGVRERAMRTVRGQEGRLRLALGGHGVDRRADADSDGGPQEKIRQRTKAAHERLMATTGLSEFDCGLRETSADLQRTAAPSWVAMETRPGWYDPRPCQVRPRARRCSAHDDASQIHFELPNVARLSEAERDAQTEAFFNRLPIEVRHEGDRAVYRPSTDSVHFPDFGLFKDANGYYATLGMESSTIIQRPWAIFFR